MKKILLLMLFALNGLATEFSQNDWRVLLETIIGDTFEFSIDFEGHTLLIHGSASDVKNIEGEIRKALSSREEFENRINYKIVRSDSESVEVLVSQEEFKLGDLKQGIKQFCALLGDAVDELSLNPKTLFSEKFGACFDGGVLCSRKFRNNSKQNYEDYRETFLSYFNGKTVGEVRAAWKGEGPLVAPENRICGASTAVVSLMQKLFSIVESDSDSGEFSLRVDLESIFKLCFPPSFELIAARDGRATLRINSEHLISYLKQLVLGDVLLRIVREGEEAQIYPILLQQKIEGSDGTHHYFVIDKSGSMYSSMPKLKQYLKEFIGHLAREDKNALVTLVFFNDSDSMRGPFAIHDGKIAALIDSQSADGDTCLFGTLTKVFALMNREVNKRNLSITLFTDGKDYNLAAFKRAEKQLKAIPASERPISITFGLDTVDHEKLSQIALASGGEYHAIRNLEDFRKIYDRTSKISHGRKLASFMTKLGERVIKEAGIYSYGNESKIVIPDISFRIKAGVKLYLENKEVQINLDTILPPTLSDKMKILSSIAFEIAKNTELSLDQRAEKLTALKGSFDEIKDNSSISEETKVKIENYQNLVAGARNNHALAASLHASLAALSGIY